MDVRIICSLISLAGIAISGLVSWFVSRSSAAKEIEKMKLSWEREDVVSSDEEFGEMCSAVTVAIHNSSGSNRAKANAYVATVRSKEQGTLGNLLDELHASLLSVNRLNEVNVILTKVIDEKRRRKSTQHTEDKQPPAE